MKHISIAAVAAMSTISAAFVAQPAYSAHHAFNQSNSVNHGSLQFQTYTNCCGGTASAQVLHVPGPNKGLVSTFTSTPTQTAAVTALPRLICTHRLRCTNPSSLPSAPSLKTSI